MNNTIDELGLEKYLEATTDFHNGLGYIDFIDLLNLKVPKTEIAKKFNVSKVTIHSWIKKIEASND